MWSQFKFAQKQELRAVLTMAYIKIAGFCDVMQCGLVDR
jgi:hypothetical protein